jgi:hypothetical protein
MSVTLYTPDEAPLVLKLHLPPTTATVTWHGASLGHPRAMLCRVHMYPVTDGFLSATHETPPILRYCFLQIDGAWHALDAFAEPDVALTAEQTAEFRLRAEHVVATAGIMRGLSKTKTANALHARFYFNNVERGSEPPPEAMLYERMIHAAVQPRISEAVEEPTEESVETAVSPTTLGIMSRIAAFTKSTLAIVVALALLLLRCVVKLRTNAEETSWLGVMYGIGQCALRVIATLVGTYITGIAIDALSSWVRRAISYAFPAYEILTRTSTNSLDAVRCIIRLMMPFVVGWVAPTTWFLGAITPILGDIPTLLLRITDEVIGVSAMSDANRKLCERIDLGRRILSSVDSLVAFFQQQLFGTLTKLGFEGISRRSEQFAQILRLSHLASKPELTSGDVAEVYSAVSSLLSALGITLPKLGPWAEVARTLFALAIFALVLAIKQTVGGAQQFGSNQGFMGLARSPKAAPPQNAEKWEFATSRGLTNLPKAAHRHGEQAVTEARAQNPNLYESCGTFFTGSCKKEIDDKIAANGRQLYRNHMEYVISDYERKQAEKERKAAEDAAAAEATAKNAAEDAAAVRQAAEDAAAVRQAAEDEVKKAAEDEVKKAAEDAAAVAEDAAKKAAEDAAAVRQAAEDAAAANATKKPAERADNVRKAQEAAKNEQKRKARRHKELAKRNRVQGDAIARAEQLEADEEDKPFKEKRRLDREAQQARNAAKKDQAKRAPVVPTEATQASEAPSQDEQQPEPEQSKDETAGNVEGNGEADKEGWWDATEARAKAIWAKSKEKAGALWKDTHDWLDSKLDAASVFADRFLYAYATLILAHYAPHSRAAIVACASSCGAGQAAQAAHAVGVEAAYVAPMSLGPRRADAIDGEARRGLVVEAGRGDLRVAQTPYVMQNETQARTGAVAYVGAGHPMWRDASTAVAAVRSKVAVPLDFIIVHEAPRSASVALSELASDYTPVLAPPDANIRLILDVGNVRIGHDTFKVWCRHEQHPLQRQLSVGMMQFAPTVPEAIERLLRAAHVGWHRQ